MPVLDTEVLFALNPADKLHRDAVLTLVASSRAREMMYAPDSAILEFEVVLRSLKRTAGEIRPALLALRKALQQNNVTEMKTLGTNTLSMQCEIEETYGLTYFDSLVAASAMTMDGVIVSNDEDFEKVPNLKRRPLMHRRT